MWRIDLWKSVCLVLSASLVSSDPDFYSAWCPCTIRSKCAGVYGSSFDDIAIFGAVPPCKKHEHIRCCSSNNIPEGFDFSKPVEYFPRPVNSGGKALLQSINDPIDHAIVTNRDDVKEYKQEVEKLKRAIARGETNPNPPCGCYTAGTCPGRYATASTGRDIQCFQGYETCCFLDDPWPDYKVTNLTINAPCATSETCQRFFGSSPLDILAFGPLEPCYLGQNRCVDFIKGDKSSNKPQINRPVVKTTTTKRPTTRRRFPSTYRTTPRPTTTTYRTTTPRRIIYQSTSRPTTYRYTFRPKTTERPTTTTFRTSTGNLAQSQLLPISSGNNIIDIVSQGAYLPPTSEFGNAQDRNQYSDLTLSLPF